MRVQGRITATSIALVAITVVVIVFTILITRVSLAGAVDEELTTLTENQLASTAQDVYRMCALVDTQQKIELQQTADAVGYMIQQAGGAALDPKGAPVTWEATDQGTGKGGPVELPRMMAGDTWFGQNTRADVATPIFDEVKRMFNVSAALFQRVNEPGDMLRVASNVVTAAGKRSIGTYIPRRAADGTESPIVAALLRGEAFAGRAPVAGDWFNTIYTPIRDKGGAVIGAYSVGYSLNERTKALRESIWKITMGKSGYVFALEGTGARRGVYVISKGGTADGTSTWESKDSDGNLFVQALIGNALKTKDGAAGFERYPWKNEGEATARMKLTAVTYFEPWDWVIGAGAYEDEFQQASIRVAGSIQTMVLLTVVVGLVMLGVSVLASFLIARGIANPLKLTTAAADRMAKGDFEFSIQHKGKDEIGDLVRSFTDMAAAQTQKAALAQKIAEGDLTENVSVASERDSLGTALKEMSDSLGDVLGQVQEAVGQVSSGSDQVAQSSQALSQGATEQASSLEEVSSALTEINSQAQRNAESATEANALAKTAVENADRGNTQMQELVAAMGRMSTSAEEITKIVKLIDDIAFQINLLALNANVEAARAGKYGKGFAVVAEEVRNLAVRSAEAVKDTTRMVGETTKAIGDGGKSAEATATQLGQIVQSVSKVADFLGEIALASREQAQGVEQISTGLGQVDQVTQANTASAEESAAAAEELSSQAQHLKGLISRFKLKGGEEGAAQEPPPPAARAVGRPTPRVAAASASPPPARGPERKLPPPAKAGGPKPAPQAGGAAPTAGGPKQPVDPKAVIRLDDDNFGKF